MFKLKYIWIEFVGEADGGGGQHLFKTLFFYIYSYLISFPLRIIALHFFWKLFKNITAVMLIKQKILVITFLNLFMVLSF